MLSFLKNKTYAIGVSITEDGLKLIQLRNDGQLSLLAGHSESLPSEIKYGSVYWQRWAIDKLKEIKAAGRFKGKKIICALPGSDTFIDHMRSPKSDNQNLDQTIIAKIKNKLPFASDDVILKYIPTDENNMMVIATERKKIDRFLAIFENAGLQVNSIAVWPTALNNSYTSLFGRRKSDRESVVMLIENELKSTNVVICKHNNLLFARSIPIGINQLAGPDGTAKLVSELNNCKQRFAAIHKRMKIERLIFVSGQAIETGICMAIAEKIELPAQIGDCAAAVNIPAGHETGIERREHQQNWASAFGLSLLSEQGN